MSKRVIIGLSGGVDSSVSAALLKEQGYDLIGVYILGWTGTKEFPCSWQQEERDAKAVADHLNIPFHTINLSKEYEQAVIDDFFSNYKIGLTPNPDILCNREIKFKALWAAVRQFEPDYIATGHYAQIKDGKIFKGQDGNKDQTYFLWGINPQMLDKVMFPIGGLDKSEVRALAKKYQLPTAAKKDSQGICFIGPLKVRSFLSSYLKPKKGKAVLIDGRHVGEHDGATLYTIGQRLGAGTVKWTGDVPPLYVIAKDVKSNLLVVGSDQETYEDELMAANANWFTKPIHSRFKCQAKVRYRQEDQEADIEIKGSELYVKFSRPVRAITPGQSIVFYNDSELIGGAVIVSSARQSNILQSINATISQPEKPTILR